MNEADASRADVDNNVPSDFIRDAIREDLAAGRYEGLMTRFPPEPNGYMHIGNAFGFCLNFEVANEFGGVCNLRFDDTNPVKEETEFVESIKEDIKWMGFDWGNRLYFASDYFNELYELAVGLIEKGSAYVCDLGVEEIREYRGTLNAPGRNSPFRDRPTEENLDLFARMKTGEFPDGARTLRAKIDMASPNINLRDPVMYRILHAEHHRTGNAWCIYPTYDWAHGQSDAIEGVSHSLCSASNSKTTAPFMTGISGELGYFPFASDRILQSLFRHAYGGGKTTSAAIDTKKGTLRRMGRSSGMITLIGPNFGAGACLLSAIRNFIRRTGNVQTTIQPWRRLISWSFTYRELSESACAPRVNGRNRSAQSGHRELPRRHGRNVRGADQSGRPVGRDAHGAVFYGWSTSSGRISWRTRPEDSAALRRGGRYRLRAACYITCTDVDEGRGWKRSLNFDARSTQRVGAGRHLTAAGYARYPPLGVRQRTRLRRRCACTIRLFNVERSAWRLPIGGDIEAETVNPKSLEVRPKLFCGVHGLKDAEPETRSYQFERLGYFCVDS